MTLANPGIYLR